MYYTFTEALVGVYLGVYYVIGSRNHVVHVGNLGDGRVGLHSHGGASP